MAMTQRKEPKKMNLKILSTLPKYKGATELG